MRDSTSLTARKELTFELKQHLQQVLAIRHHFTDCTLAHTYCCHCCHLFQTREAQQEYADTILRPQRHKSVESIAIDAVDQAKHHCPLHAFTSRATSKISKIIQQQHFIGVLDHRRGYGVYRRLTYVHKGVDLTTHHID